MDGEITTITQQQLAMDADAEADRMPNDPTQLEIRRAMLEIHKSRRSEGKHLRRQLARWRWQAPHCPAELSRLMLSYRS
jgi:hypothetical protein